MLLTETARGEGADDEAGADPAFRDNVLRGLAARPRAIPARWLYDHRGSELFEDITRLPEYYPTRAETALLAGHGAAIATRIGPGRAVIEFGSGSSVKTPHLLRAIDPAAYVPIDISGDFLRQSAAALAAHFPDLPIAPVEADFMHPIALPERVRAVPKLGFFPGSTIGNLTPRSATDLLRAMRGTLEGDDDGGAMLLIGMDRVKDRDTLIAAYDDATGVTAAFNLNLLTRINRELDADIPIDAFRHEARWNALESRIEMHLVAQHDVAFGIGSERFEMAAGDTIHTENSHKYSPRSARLLLSSGGWTPIAEWIAPDDAFALILAEATPERAGP